MPQAEVAGVDLAGPQVVVQVVLAGSGESELVQDLLA